MKKVKPNRGMSGLAAAGTYVGEQQLTPMKSTDVPVGSEITFGTTRLQSPLLSVPAHVPILLLDACLAPCPCDRYLASSPSSVFTFFPCLVSSPSSCRSLIVPPLSPCAEVRGGSTCLRASMCLPVCVGGGSGGRASFFFLSFPLSSQSPLSSLPPPSFLPL